MTIANNWYHIGQGPMKATCVIAKCLGHSANGLKKVKVVAQKLGRNPIVGVRNWSQSMAKPIPCVEKSRQRLGKIFNQTVMEVPQKSGETSAESGKQPTRAEENPSRL